MSSANAFNLDWSQFLSFGKELNPPCYTIHVSYILNEIENATHIFLLNNSSYSIYVHLLSRHYAWLTACSYTLSLSLDIFILHRLRNKFLQLILISLDSAFWKLHQYSRRMCGAMKNSQS